MKINAILTSFWSNAKTYLSNNYLSKTDVASKDTLGGVKTTSTVTSTSGLTATPIIDGVPYYKDTNTTYSSMSASEATTGTATTARTITAKVLNDKINEKLSGDVVKLSGDQTISGTKTFDTRAYLSGGATISASENYKIELNGSSNGSINAYGAGTLPESNINPFRFYVGKAKNYASAPIVFDTSFSSKGSTAITLRSASNSETTTENRLTIGCSVVDETDGIVSYLPYVQFYNTKEIRSSGDNKALLGTTDKRWADVNTVLLNGKTPAYADDLTSKANSSDLSNYLPLSGGQLTNKDISRNGDTSELRLNGGTALNNGASFIAYGKNTSLSQTNMVGGFIIRACNGTNTVDIKGSPDGTLTWNSKNISLEGHTHTEYLGKSDKAASATTADKITLTETNPTSASSYYMTYAGSSSNNAQRYNNGCKYYTLEGTASALGYGILMVGNGTASGTAGNKYGGVRIYSKTAKYATISGNTDLTANPILTVPNVSGTLMCTGNLTTTLGSGNGTAGMSDASIGIGSLVLGFVSKNNMASAISSTKSNGFLNISGSSINLASLNSKSAPTDVGSVAEITYATTTLSGTWRFLGYNTMDTSGTQTTNMGILGLFIRIA